ncbi:3-KETOACYL-COA SYNTHASE 2-LIKE [Salix koriyanagi]|uniref:3-KETOACYL-COA SYNTHASE 2-LIKE n=1 Tax=Salix koriyanagi TaxID=2511006 RepID=A0A9Q0QMG2_9ROSI|nr:3-KETOACYL-COA SYNTHASE 2-LIKE [Salix koriyanagi]
MRTISSFQYCSDQYNMFRITMLASNDLPKFIFNHSSLFSDIIAPLFCLTLIALLLSRIFDSKPSRKVFLLDFACYKPPAGLTWSKELVIERARQACTNLSEETLEFMEKLLEKSGLGPSTYLPDAFRRDPPNECLDDARNESEMVIFGAVDELLAKTGVKGEDIGIVIVNCGVLEAAPSLSAMIVNRYKLGDKVASYDLSGMGCSAGLAAACRPCQTVASGTQYFFLCSGGKLAQKTSPETAIWVRIVLWS